MEIAGWNRLQAICSICFLWWQPVPGALEFRSPYIRWLWNKIASGKCIWGPYHVLCYITLSKIFWKHLSLKTNTVYFILIKTLAIQRTSLCPRFRYRQSKASPQYLWMAQSMLYRDDLQVVILLKLISNFCRSV